MIKFIAKIKLFIKSLKKPLFIIVSMAIPNYTEANIRSLAWQEHLRLRPGMYIGKLGDGSLPDDGIYILIKEVIDNSVDEFVIGYGKKIEIKTSEENAN